MIYNINDFDYKIIAQLPLQKRRKGNPGRRDNSRKYKDIICAFDIETTNDDISEQSFMYVWQFQFGNDITVIGRTWSEYLEFLRRICERLKKNEYIVIYVHNLSFEFQFLRGIYPFESDEVFATQPRKVLKCEMLNHLEYRCSYQLTNMNLASFTSRMGVESVKLSGDEFNYKKERYSWTKLTDYETQYIINDVKGLVEALYIYMDINGDNLYTIPLTSTGFVRRDVRYAMRRYNKRDLKDMLPDYELFKLLRGAFRGGNTHANRYYVDTIITNVNSRDFSSAYPAAQVVQLFPMSPFIKEDCEDITMDRVITKIYKHGRACLMRVKLYNIELCDRFWGFPYLAKAKCDNIINCENDNGRILSADYLETSLTDLDFKIILKEYKFESIEFESFYHARYGKLPKPLKETVLKYFYRKTELKGVKGEELYYMKAKNMLNSVYGMSVQSPVKQSIDFIDETFNIRYDDECELLEKANQKAFLTYSWGVWVTAWARYELENALELVHNTKGATPIYCDTDSVKYIGDVDFKDFNAERERKAIINGGYAKDPLGGDHYLGVLENDGFYEEFATLGAKKYVYVEAGKLNITIAGVNKRKGAEELKSAGGISKFKEGFIFRKAGGLELIYNDKPEITEIMREGRKISITSNVYMRDSEYTLGVTGEYRIILDRANIWRDMLEMI